LRSSCSCVSTDAGRCFIRGGRWPSAVCTSAVVTTSSRPPACWLLLVRHRYLNRLPSVPNAPTALYTTPYTLCVCVCRTSTNNPPPPHA